jgi:hypothetical protein
MLDLLQRFVNDDSFAAASQKVENTSDPLTPLPVPDSQRTFWRSVPRWILSSTKLKENPPTLQFSNVSVHILNQGHGAFGCVTIRQIDDESSGADGDSWKDIKSASKAGIIGRLITAIRIKLFEVNKK